MRICSKCGKDSCEFYSDVGCVCKECKKKARKHHYNKIKNTSLYKETRSAENKKYRENNRDKVNEIRRRWHGEQMQQNPQYRATVTIRKRMQSHLKARKNGLRQKAGSPIDYLGCSVAEFVSHTENLFEAGMFWDNHGTKWELDHKIPLASFNLSNKEDFKKACHYTNLQPLWIDDHRNKTRKEVLSYKSPSIHRVLLDTIPQDDAAGDSPETS